MSSNNQYLVMPATKKCESCRRTLRGEGHSAVDLGTGGSVKLLLWVQSPFVRAMGGR